MTVPKIWKNDEVGGTPLSAAAMIDLEQRLAAYAEAVAAGGVELGKAISTTLNFSLTTILADLPGMSKTVTVRTRPIEIDAFIPTTSVSAAGRTRLALYEGTTLLQLCDSTHLASNGVVGSLHLYANLEPSAGDHTYKLQGATVTAAGGTMLSGATFPALLSIKEV